MSDLDTKHIKNEEYDNIDSPKVKKLRKLILDLQKKIDYSTDDDQELMEKIRTIENNVVVLRLELQRINKKINNIPNDGATTIELENTLDTEQKKLESQYLSSLNKLYELLNEKIMIMEGVTILMGQLFLNSRDEAVKLLKENEYKPALAILKHKEKSTIITNTDTITYFTFQLNQHELLNEFVKLSKDRIDYTIIESPFPPRTVECNQSYVCVIINSDSPRKMKKYASLDEIYTTFVNSNLNTRKLIRATVNSEHFALMYDINNIITITDIQNYDIQNLNKPLTIILRNFSIISDTQYYINTGLLVNNCFLN